MFAGFISRCTMLLFPLLILAPACPPPQPIDAGPLPFDASAPCASQACRVCRNLAAQGCEEGARGTCADRVQKAIDSKITTVNPACLEGATGKGAVRACGTFVGCP